MNPLAKGMTLQAKKALTLSYGVHMTTEDMDQVTNASWVNRLHM
jgi:hypothetical protein